MIFSEEQRVQLRARGRAIPVLCESAPNFKKLRDLLDRAEQALGSDPIKAKSLLDDLIYDAREAKDNVDTSKAKDMLYAKKTGVLLSPGTGKGSYQAMIMKSGKYWAPAHTWPPEEAIAKFSSYTDAEQKMRRNKFKTKADRISWVKMHTKILGIPNTVIKAADL